MKKKFTYLPIVCWLGIFILFGNSSKALTRTWNIAVGGAWGTAANWTPVGVPAINDDLVFNNGNTFTVTGVPGQTLTSILADLNTNVTLSGGGFTITIKLGGNITVNSGSTLICGTAANKINLTINGNITNNGTFLATGSNLIFQGNQLSTIGGTASTLASTTFTFGTLIWFNKPNTVSPVLVQFNIPVTMTGAITVNNGAGASTSYYEVDNDFTCNGSINLSNNGNLRFNTGTLTCTGFCTFNPTSPNIATLTLTSGETASSFGSINITGGASSNSIFYDSLAAGKTNTVSGNVQINNLNSYLYMVTNHTMFVGGNWTNNGTFNTFPLGVGVGTVTFNSVFAQTIGTGGNFVSTNFNNLTINNTSGIANGVTLTYPQFVNGVFTLSNGKLTSTAANLLTLNATATSSSGSNASYVYGPMAKVIASSVAPAFMFPVGKDDGVSFAECLPIGMTGFVGAGPDTFTAELIKRNIDAVFTPSSPYVNYPHDAWVTNVDSCEYWTLTRSQATMNSKIVLSWNSSYCVVGAPSNLRVLTINGPNWSDLDAYPLQNPTANVLGADSGYVTSFNTSSNYVAYTLGSDSIYINPLPINLISFTATPRHNDVLVEWTTASELNNASYTLEKEISGLANPALSSFAPIAIFEGAGNSTTTHHYQYVDDSPFKAKQWWNYYRLKQTDFDGKYNYFGPVAVRLNSSVEIGIYPTVSSGLFYYTGDWQDANVTVYSADGREVFNTIITNEESSLNLSALPQGLYFVSIQTNDGITESRLIKTSDK
jgi:hypothetical protein